MTTNYLGAVVIDTSSNPAIRAGGICPVLSQPVGGVVLLLMPWGDSLTMHVDTMRHDGLNGEFITFTTLAAISLAEYERTRGF